MGVAEEAEPPPVDGNTLGVYVELDPRPLRRFYKALHKLEDGEDEDGKVRVLVYGASHTAADVYTSYLRAYLQTRFGNAGLGYVSLARTNRWYRLFALNVSSSKGWLTQHAQRRNNPRDGLYGLLGASVTAARTRDYGRVTPNERATATDGKTTYDFLFLKHPNGGTFSVTIGDEEVATVSTKAEEATAGYYSVTRDEGPLAVEVKPVDPDADKSKTGKKSKKSKKKRKKRKPADQIRLFGMTLETDANGVVVDTLGIPGTRASNHLKWDETLWKDNFQHRDPDLYILAYGTNEATDRDVPISHYRKTLREVLQRFRAAAPEASCLLVGPGDYQRKNKSGVYVPVPRTVEINEAQREVAEEMNCGFWDAMEFMGGVGSIDVWARSEPQMAKSDHIHLTKRGYLRMGMALTDALMEEYDNPSPAPASR